MSSFLRPPSVCFSGVGQYRFFSFCYASLFSVFLFFCFLFWLTSISFLCCFIFLPFLVYYSNSPHFLFSVAFFLPFHMCLVFFISGYVVNPPCFFFDFLSFLDCFAFHFCIYLLFWYICSSTLIIKKFFFV